MLDTGWLIRCAAVPRKDEWLRTLLAIRALPEVRA